VQSSTGAIPSAAPSPVQSPDINKTTLGQRRFGTPSASPFPPFRTIGAPSVPLNTLVSSPQVPPRSI
jgi:hypothetical protein